MDKVKKIIIVLTILILVAISIIVLIVIFNKADKSETIDSEGNVEYNSEEGEKNIVKYVTDKNIFFSVKDCVERYYTVIENLWYR